MPTVIDSFVVEVGLDDRKFTEGERSALASFKKTKDSAADFAKDLEEHGKHLADVFGVVRKGALGLVGAFVGAEAANFIDKIANMDAAVGRMSRTIGVSNPALSTWVGLIREIGGDAGSATSALLGLQTAMTNAQQGRGMLPPGAIAAFNMMGANFNTDNADQVLRKAVKFFGDAVVNGQMTVPQAAGFLRSIPGMNEDMISLILKGSKAWEEMSKTVRKVTDENVAAATEYVKKVNELSMAWERLGAHVVPVLTWIADKLANIAELFATSPDSPEGKKILESGPNDDDRRAFTEWLMGPRTAEELYGPKGGIPVKPGAGTISPAMQKVLDVISSVPGIEAVTAGNDNFHAGFASPHNQGRAVDLRLKDAKQAEAVTAAIRKALADSGINATVLDETEKRSEHWTGPHIHIGISAAHSLSGMPAGAAAATRASTTNNNRRFGDTVTSTTHIDHISLNLPNAKDAEGIARGLAPEIKKRMAMASAANYGYTG